MITEVAILSYPFNALIIGGAGGVLYCFALGLWRLYFSPIAKFPGPRLAALTYLVEIYYELLCGEGGQFPFQYRKWHQQYGPIIRVSPDELHIQDSAYHETMYSPNRPVNKPEKIAHRFGNPLSAFATPDHAKHRQRRSALNPFFSKMKVAQFSPEIQMSMQKILARLEREYVGTGRVLSLNRMWGCLSSDTIVAFAFERHYDFVESPEFHSALNQAMIDLLEPTHWLVHVPFVARIFQSLPDSLVRYLQPQMDSVIHFNTELTSQIAEVLSAGGNGEKNAGTIFSSLLHSSLPAEELTLTRLQHESISVIGAGVESTMRTLVVACFHIFDNPRIKEKLVMELTEAIPDARDVPSWDYLAQLPYLSACIEEALRLSYGTSQRMPRAFPNGALHYRNWTIPAGTMVSMDTYAVSHDEEIFPDSFSFIPERWLGNPKAPDGKQLSRYMVSFGKGTRSCTGIQLGYAELYIGLANFFRSSLISDAKLYKTDKSDVELARDRFAPRPKLGSLGVRIVFE
ncbi:putative P450 monooxygenase [Phyllosticta citribraziliensis]|uniref:P450 monooxygenase n=1 Tax=Phyllosticta citribraziliensis TaxID=989973 RepID=A0ABR1M4W9_9PEZI